MDEHRLPKRLLEMKVARKRPKGRPKLCWLDQVKKGIETRERSWEKVEEMQE
jgi:hypothetical protein